LAPAGHQSGSIASSAVEVSRTWSCARFCDWIAALAFDRSASLLARVTDTVVSMREVLPGVYHWTAIHPRIHITVSSYWLENGGVLIDPLIPPDAGLDWFAQRSTKPAAIVLSNRHHYRDSSQFVEAFAIPVFCVRTGLHEFTHGEEVIGFDPGEHLPGGLVGIEIGGLCPDETALEFPAGRALFVADGVVRAAQDQGPLGFVPDSLMDDPPETRQKLLDAYRRVLREVDFEHLLLAHGGPLIADGRAQLQEFVDSGGRTAFEL
jgi:glyoxylase-like metal-dependent hydrolase (beta-lactamase superfamily II)